MRGAGRRILVIAVEDYTHFVPFVESDEEISSTRVTPMDKLDFEGKEILGAYESGRLKRVKNKRTKLDAARKLQKPLSRKTAG